MQRIGAYEKAYLESLSWDVHLMGAAIAGFDFLEMSIDNIKERRVKRGLGKFVPVMVERRICALKY